MVKFILLIAVLIFALPPANHKVNAGKSCLDCHDDKGALTPRDHKMNWSRHHGKEALIKKQECALCHAEQECSRCHGASVPGERKPHPVNYTATHGRDAKSGRDQCMTCHRGGESCNSCHKGRKVVPRSHMRAGFVNMTNGGSHAREAKWNIGSCQSCHGVGRKEPTCAACHGKMDSQTGATVRR
ncbi:MAG: hypothetical protein JNL74_01050 [Fibrobacteres bacterium]|nr:hypothetical protein [Fibrobacterota bacterium]